MDILGFLISTSPLALIVGFLFFKFGSRKKNKKIELFGERLYLAAAVVFLGWLLLSIGAALIWGVED